MANMSDEAFNPEDVKHMSNYDLEKMFSILIRARNKLGEVHAHDVEHYLAYHKDDVPEMLKLTMKAVDEACEILSEALPDIG